MKHGIIMELSGNHAIIMTPQGEFLKIHKNKRQWQVGQEVSFTPPAAHFPRRVMRWTAAVAAVFLALFIGLPGIFGPSEAVAAYVTMDINPSLELSINKKQVVIDVTPLNDDAKQMLSSLKLSGLKVEQAALIVVEQAEKAGYIRTEGADILVTTTAAGNEQINEDEINSNIQQLVNKKGNTHKNVTVAVFIAPKEVREEAQKEKISTGKYTIYLAAKQKGINVSIEQLKADSVNDLAKSIHGIGTIIGHPLSKDSLKELVEKEKKGQGAKPKKGKNQKPSSNEENNSYGKKQDQQSDQPKGNNGNRENQGNGKDNGKNKNSGVELDILNPPLPVVSSPDTTKNGDVENEGQNKNNKNGKDAKKNNEKKKNHEEDSGKPKNKGNTSFLPYGFVGDWYQSLNDFSEKNTNEKEGN